VFFNAADPPEIKSITGASNTFCMCLYSHYKASSFIMNCLRSIDNKLTAHIQINSPQIEVTSTVT
jgi:hypothetical protein